MSFVSQPKDRIQELVRIIRIRLNRPSAHRCADSPQQRQRDYWAKTVVVDARTFHVLRAREFRIVKAALRKYAATDAVVRRAAHQVVQLLFILKRFVSFSDFNRKTCLQTRPELFRPRGSSWNRQVVGESPALSWSTD